MHWGVYVLTLSVVRRSPGREKPLPSRSTAGTRIQVDSRLAEVDYGTYSAAPVQQVDQLRSAHVTAPFPEGESYEQRLILMRDFLEDFARKHRGRIRS